MNEASTPSIGPLRIAIATLTFVLTLAVRVWGINTRFWLLGDQIRDWTIALRPFSELPLVGPPTHVGGYTIGPAFYWILWAIRVSVGPWFDNLPHAGGIGQAILQSGADTLLLVAVWRRTQSIWIALTTVVLLATAAFDLSLSALIWNPVAGETLAKIATALVLLNWSRRSGIAVALTAAVAWCAVQSYTGAIFVAVSVFVALLIDPIARGDRGSVRRNAVLIGVVVVLLQLPHAAHQVANRFSDSAMAAVTGGVGRILSGSDGPRFAESQAGYAGAFSFIEVQPWQLPWFAWVLTACGAIVAVRYRRDPPILTMTLLPQLAAIVGYAFFLGELAQYYYLSLMPAAVLTILLGATAMPSHRVAHAVSIVLFVAAVAIAPARIRFAATMLGPSPYGVVVEASREIVRLGRPMRAIETDFSQPPTSDPEFVYKILGGQIDRASPWVGVITADGRVVYRRVEGS